MGEFQDFSRFKLKSNFIGSKLTISLTVATIFVTKPFIHEGLIRRDKETVKFWVLYQALMTIHLVPGKANGKVLIPTEFDHQTCPGCGCML
jgi:hypothetical protein